MSSSRLTSYNNPMLIRAEEVNASLFTTNLFVDRSGSNNNSFVNDHTMQAAENWRMNTFTIVSLSVLFFLIVTIGVLGNILVIVVIFCDVKMRRSVTNMLIINLAVADLIIMVLGVPEIAMFMMNKGWILGFFACRCNRFILVTALYSSVLSLLILCCERFIAIVFPFKVTKMCTRQKTVFTITALWMSAVCGALPVALYNQLLPVGGPVQHCQIFLPGENPIQSFIIYKYIEAVLFYFTPMFIQVILYSVIAKRLFASNEQLRTRFQMRSMRSDVTVSNASTSSSSSPISAANDRSDTIKARRGVVKMLVSSVLLYFISYSPVQFRLVYNTFSSSDVFSSHEFFIFVIIITHINSAANPVLYGIFSQNFRRHFQQCFRSGLKCRKEQWNGTHSNHYNQSSRLFRMTTTRSTSFGRSSNSRL